MKLTSAGLAFLAAGLCRAAATDVLHNASIHPDDDDDGGDIVLPQQNRNGWVNPEDILPMPQCIAQQDPSAWLDIMTRCTGKRCTSKFAFICTHSQWLTQLSCLSDGFSPSVVREYLPYCSRSVLAKAQLYNWIRSITGRTWLVDVGDANGLESLSPASLATGYATEITTYYAPSCLTGSLSSTSSMEPFERVMKSCSFVDTAEFTGDPTRPWEYSGPQHSMNALGFEVVGYDLTGRIIGYGNYFDKTCFCDTFTVSAESEPCSDPRQIDFTRERLWMSTTCGPASLPDSRTDLLRVTGPVYISADSWSWPECFADMPKQVTERVDQCATDACELHSSGYCSYVRRAVDSSCFCRDLTYDSCGDSCHFFETRVEYVTWLYDICGSIQDWHGLPENWRELAEPLRQDMIPWRWALQPAESCAASSDWKIGSFVLVNAVALLSAFLSWETGFYHVTRGFMSHPRSLCWFSKGAYIASLHIFANWLNAFIVSKTPGYENVPVNQLTLLWSSMPRPGWLPILRVGVHPFKGIDASVVASCLFAEMLLQALSSYYMLMTIDYGLEHSFYFGRLENNGIGVSAQIMYAGALLWLIAIAVLFAQLMRAVLAINRLSSHGQPSIPRWQTDYQTPSDIAEALLAQKNEPFAWVQRTTSDAASEWPTWSRIERRTYTTYGTVPVARPRPRDSRQIFAQLYVLTAVGMLFLWAAQWLFWGGFISLSSEEFCPPHLKTLTFVWVYAAAAVVFGRHTRLRFTAALALFETVLGVIFTTCALYGNMGLKLICL